MLRFLSKFNLATRIYAGFLFLGLYVVLICFAAMFAVGYVHNEYMKANNVIENTRQISALETYLFSLNRSLFFFASKGTEEEKADVERSFQTFKEKNTEVENSLVVPQVKEKFNLVLSDILKKYDVNITEMFSLYEKSAEAEKKVNNIAEKVSAQINDLIEETTLPSASFALNSLKEQLENVLHAIDNVTPENETSRKQLDNDLSALKKAQNTTKQAEMINAKQLKDVFDSLNSLDEEINRKLKIDVALREKIQAVSLLREQNSKDFKDLISSMAQSCTNLLSQAEAGKISLQKAFVFAAAFGGFLSVLLSFLSLFGIRYPLARLIENAQEIARGDRSVLIHFTERDDEVGALAKSLALLTLRLKDFPLWSDETLLGHKSSTYGSTSAYVPLGTPNATNGENEEHGSDAETGARSGKNIGADTEKQLCKMLSFVQNISISAVSMTNSIKERFYICRDHLYNLTEQLQLIGKNAANVKEHVVGNSLNDLVEQIQKVLDSFSICFSLTDEMQELLKNQISSSDKTDLELEKIKGAITGLTEWVKVGDELTDVICSSSAETKILALNAAIEAAKAGENAKAFGNVASDMRQRTQKTLETAQNLTNHLMEIRQQITLFSETTSAIVSQFDLFKQNMSSLLTINDTQTERIRSIFDSAQGAKADMEKAVVENDSIQQELDSISGLVVASEERPPLLETQIIQVEELLDDFKASLPSYEQDEEEE